MAEYITRHLQAGTAATLTYADLTASTSGGTPGTVKVPTGANRITKIIATASAESTVVVDVGNVFVIKLSGKALMTGDQEIVVGSLLSQEDGTSVGITIDSRPATVIPVSIGVRGGSELMISGAYGGTDTGTQNFSVTLEFSASGGRSANYFTRLDSMTQAQQAFSPVETTAGNATSTIAIPPGASKITKLIAAVTLNAAAVVTGANYVVKLSGSGMTEQEIVVSSTQYEAGAGTTTDTFVAIRPPVVIPVDIDVSGGNNLFIDAAYVGTDPGTPFIGVTVEVV